MRIIESILNFLFPTTCLFCKYGDKIVCESCFAKIPQNVQIRDSILSIYEYRNPQINKMLWKLKYHHTHDIAKLFGKVLTVELSHMSGVWENKNIYLIPIPLNSHDKRIYNHAELIANATKLNVTPNLLVKSSNKKQAHTKNKKERFENIKNSFSINRKIPEVEPKEECIYILIDDVCTTGATLQEAKETLIKSLNIPTQNIFAVVVAR